jgi:hypothetical protein
MLAADTPGLGFEMVAARGLRGSGSGNSCVTMFNNANSLGGLETYEGEGIINSGVDRSGTVPGGGLSVFQEVLQGSHWWPSQLEGCGTKSPCISWVR